MQFRRQLFVGHAALLLVTLITGAVAAIALRISTARLESVTRELTAGMFAIQRLDFQADRLLMASRGLLFTGDPVAARQFDEAAALVTETLAEIHRLRTDLTDEVARIDRAAADYVTAAQRAAKDQHAHGDPKDVVPWFEETLEPVREQFQEALVTFVSREQAAFEDESHRARTLADRAEEVVVITTAISVLLGIALAVQSSRKLARQYARARAAIEAARRATAARDELVAIVSHDLRNPLATIIMGTDLLRETETNPRLRKQVSMIAHAAEVMQHLIDQLLDVAKLEHGTLGLRFERCELSQLFESLQALFQGRAAEAQVELAIQGEPGLAVTADRERVLQVLSNLVANALKFTPRGGKIAVAARRDGALARFEVSDTGPGIPDDQIPHLFERFWQATSSQRGSLGLGLYICKQLVTAHRGEIGVRTKLGQGSTFWFTLPTAGA